MSRRQQLLQLLADGRWHSGEELAASLGLSRAAVWKQLGVLRDQLGLHIHSVRGRGYKLPEQLELLEEGIIRSALSDDTLEWVSQIEIHDTITSTNSHLMEKGAGNIRTGHVCLAERQSEGRGRRGRNWASPFGSNIYLSLFWEYGLAPAALSGISLAAGLAVIRALRQLGVSEIGLKWPNDILHGEKKLAGLLLEVAGEQSGPSRVVLGLGLNVRLKESDAETIDQPWESLSRLPGGATLSRNRIVAALLENLVTVLAQFEQNGLKGMITEWRQYDLFDGKRVVLQMGSRQIEGVHRGVESSGALLLETADGIRAFHGGEVSLRRLD
ncbi:bifunctional biotin--[acetyl-CoA-carboxylase] ligase/biotin operon repressor BirA [Sedimenticola sp.]|uniref:bifunctional biotin--[acetyl-CoA-carboxylase] ligase/biotin operon repressor BirA n=1 Tax=Sedimenticola sp. TaxID=1940285 RepID=UPI003D139479